MPLVRRRVFETAMIYRWFYPDFPRDSLISLRASRMMWRRRLTK